MKNKTPKTVVPNQSLFEHTKKKKKKKDHTILHQQRESSSKLEIP